MKTWIKRTLIGLASATALLGGLAAFAGHQHHRWQNMTAEERAEMRARMVERAARHLDLDAAQKAKLTQLGDQLHAQRQTMFGQTGNPRAELQQLIAGTAFDRTGASALLQTKLGALQQAGPELINAVADFYDSLRPEQQAKLRELLNRGPHGHRG